MEAVNKIISNCLIDITSTLKKGTNIVEILLNPSYPNKPCILIEYNKDENKFYYQNEIITDDVFLRTVIDRNRRYIQRNIDNLNQINL